MDVIAKKYYVYRHIRLDKYQPFYIGIATKYPTDLKYGYYTRANLKSGRNNLWQKIANKTKYKVEILLESEDLNLIKRKEEYFIRLYGRKNTKTGILANLTDGGEKNKGRIFLTPKKIYIKKGIRYDPSLKVKNTQTGEIYKSINEAALAIKHDSSSLCRKLNGIYKNNTNLKLI